ncbi:MinD/ParA family ATP-binding protein [Citricoccus zhacaiensis]
MTPVSTLTLTAKVTLIDRTGTRVTAGSLAEAMSLIDGQSHQSTPVLALATRHESDSNFEPGRWALDAGQLGPAPVSEVPDYLLEYTDWQLADSAGSLSPVTTTATLETVGQAIATKADHEVTITSDLPGVRPHKYTPASNAMQRIEQEGGDSTDAADYAALAASRWVPHFDEDMPTLLHDEHPASTAQAFATRTQTRRQLLAPARSGWQGTLNHALGLSLAPGSTERHTRSLHTTIQQGLAGHRTAVVVNIKGGASKTTATYLLGATLGRIRGGMILAWDNNENSGNLADRALSAAHSHTALDLLERIEDFTTPEHADQLAGYVRPQGDNKFHVLASQNEAGNKEVINASAFRMMHTALRQFYGLAIVDTGNASTAPTWQAAIDVADVLVIAISNKEDAARRAFTTIDALRNQGYADKLANAVAIVTQPRTASPQRLQDITDTLTGLVRAVEVIPFDRALDDGGQINWEALSAGTRHAYLKATAHVIEGM